MAACGDNTDTATVPNKPASFSATAGDSQVALSWTAPSSDGGSAITKYEVKKDSDAWLTASSNTTHTFTGLTNGTEYTFKVRAVNAKGNSEEASATATPTIQTAPTAPQNFSATAGDAQAVLTWAAPASNGGSAITGYQVTNDNWTTKTDKAADVLTHTFTGLTNGTAYTFKVRAVNARGNGAESTASATPTTSATQLVMGEISYDNTTKIVSWDVVANATGYTLRIGTSDKASNLITENGTKMQYIMNEATSGNLDIYVKALGNGTTYSDSAEKHMQISYTAKLAVPANVEIFLATLSWDAVSGATGYSVQVDNQTPIAVGNVTEYLLLSLIVPKTYSIKVKATANGTNYDDSDFSAAANYTAKTQNDSAGSSFSLVIDKNGSLWSFGYNNYGQLGNGTTDDSNVPVQIKSGTKFAAVSAGADHSLAIDFEGNLWAWGRNNYGKLGNGTMSISVPEPILIKEGTKFAAVSAGTDHSLAIDFEGNLWAWGGNASGRLGDGTTIAKIEPLQVAVGTEFVSVSAKGSFNSIAIDSNGHLWSWGYYFDNVPARIKDDMRFNSIHENEYAIDIYGGLWYFDTENVSYVIYESDIEFAMISARYILFTLILDRNGTLWALGVNGAGQMGNGTTNSDYDPTLRKIVEEKKFVMAVTNGYFCLAIDVDGNLWTWGANTRGQLGNGTNTNSSTPIKITLG